MAPTFLNIDTSNMIDGNQTNKVVLQALQTATSHILRGAFYLIEYIELEAILQWDN